MKSEVNGCVWKLEITKVEVTRPKVGLEGLLNVRCDSKMSLQQK